MKSYKYFRHIINSKNIYTTCLDVPLKYFCSKYNESKEREVSEKRICINLGLVIW